MTVLVAAVALVGIAAPALASWASTGTGTGQVSARALNPATGLGTTAGSPSHTAIDVNFTSGSNPAGTTYTVTRDKKKDGTAGPEVACSGLTSSPCQDTGLTASTAYTYTVKAVLGGWSKQTPGSASRTTAAAPVTSATSYTVKLVAAPFIQNVNQWRGRTEVTVKDNLGVALASVTVSGTYSTASSTTVSCTTGAAGTCNIDTGNLSRSTIASTTFTRTGQTGTALTFDSANSDNTAVSNRPAA